MRLKYYEMEVVVNKSQFKQRLASRTVWRQEFLKREMIFVLTYIIVWMVCVFALCYITGLIHTMDYGFLTAWLPENRVLDLGHFKELHEQWKTTLDQYLRVQPEGSFVQEVKEEIQAWRMCQIQFGGVVCVGLILSIGKIIKNVIKRP